MLSRERERCAHDRRTATKLVDIADAVRASRDFVDIALLATRASTDDDMKSLEALLLLISDRLTETATTLATKSQEANANVAYLPRRAVLAGISTLPAALAVAALPAPAMTVPVASADAALIRIASRVSRLARIEERLLARCGRIEDAIVDPPRPERPTGSKLTMTSSGWSDDGREFKVAWDRPFHESDEQERQHKAAVDAWEAERLECRERAGLTAMERTRSAILLRLEEATEILTAMRPATMAGLAAKARAWQAIDDDGSQDSWTEDLLQSIARDAIEIEGSGLQA